MTTTRRAEQIQARAFKRQSIVAAIQKGLETAETLGHDKKYDQAIAVFCALERAGFTINYAPRKNGLR